jgi:hypothetical protein
MQEPQYRCRHFLTTAPDKGEGSTYRYDFRNAESDNVKCGMSKPAYCININLPENISLRVLIKFPPSPILKSLTTFHYNKHGMKRSSDVADMTLPFKKLSQNNTR